MLSTDREDFDKQLEVLFGGHPTVFLTQPRREAYWRGLQKMPLAMFVRCVDHALQDSSELAAKVPSVNRIWDISRHLKSRAASAAPTFEQPVQLDDYALLGNRWLLAFLVRRALDPKAPWSPDEPTLQRLLATKDRIVQQFRAGGGINDPANIADAMDVATAAFTREYETLRNRQAA